MHDAVGYKKEFGELMETEGSVHGPFWFWLHAGNKVGHQIKPWSHDSNSDCWPSLVRL